MSKPKSKTATDMWRVDVSGYPCSVRGSAAADHLGSVNRRLAKMRLALHRIRDGGAPEEFEAIAREALNND
jgi:hypothetical protein